MIVCFLVCCGMQVQAQNMPSVEENIPFLVTFSKQADKKWGDDDFIQIYFIAVPQSRVAPFYIRIFDADNGGKHDENRNGFNSKTKYSVYGGAGAHSNDDAKKQDPSGNFKSGILLAGKTFSVDTAADNKWYSFGPFNPSEGELQPNFGGYIFKVIVEGQEGDDGNLYKISISESEKANKPVEGSNGFTYEYCFRTSDVPGTVSHVYPFVTPEVISVNVSSFDYDSEGIVRIVSVSKKNDVLKVSQDGNWVNSEHKVVTEEHNTSLDIQMIKKTPVKNNNMVLYITNQYGKLLPFFATPIGGVPKYKGKITVKKK
ncbi:MAG: hypothetical protein IT233_06845 [Bacteroidia bacterium]|nr:hypothetical protein [Bacteroidia bacterium]